MAESLRILVAHAHPPSLRHLLDAIGQQWEILAACATVKGVTDAVAAQRPDVIVTGVAFPDGDGVEMAIEIGRDEPMPAVIIASDASMEKVLRAMQDHVMAYLTEPVTPETLHAAVIVARIRFDQLRELESEVGTLRQALADRKIIERAKGVLMAHERLSEEEAYRRLRSESQDRRLKLVDVAQQVFERFERSVAVAGAATASKARPER